MVGFKLATKGKSGLLRCPEVEFTCRTREREREREERHLLAQEIYQLMFKVVLQYVHDFLSFDDVPAIL